MRAIWKGSISFGLVNVPVGLYSATRPGEEIKFHLLRSSDKSRIQYKRVAESDGREVAWEDIVKGYEYEKDHFVTLDKKDFEKVDLKSNQVIDIKEFVNLAEIDPMFFDEPYFLAPEKAGGKAYALLRQALQDSGKVGIAKVVIKTREHLAAVKPMGKALVLELMHFSEELADPKELTLPKEEVGKKELAMAHTLVDSMSGRWQPANYKDEYRHALMELIKKKLSGKHVEAPPKARAATNVVDLMTVLRASLESARNVKPKKPAAADRAAAKAKKRKAA
jgi:DNA end-binding protein Ku